MQNNTPFEKPYYNLQYAKEDINNKKRLRCESPHDKSEQKEKPDKSFLLYMGFI
jgi:hypothetical protein